MGKAVRIVLKSKNKLGFIDGSISKPVIKEGEFVAVANAWEMLNSMISFMVPEYDRFKVTYNVHYGDTTHEI